MKEIYLDNAATSWPKPKAVIKAMNDYFYHIGGSSGRSGHRRAIEASRLIMEARASAAELLGVRDDANLIFTSNATSALNMVINGIFDTCSALSASHIVVTTMEHNSVLRPVNRLVKKGLRITSVQADAGGKVEPGAFEAAITPETRLAVVTHASNICGTVNDIAEISRVCRASSVPLLVDGAQTAGVVPINIDALGLDFFACAGHKGLLGPQGTGLLYIKDKDSLPAVISGGTGSLSDSTQQPDFPPDKFESGTPNIIGIAGLAEGCRYLLDRGVESILQHDRRLLEIFVDMLTGIEGITLFGTGDAASSTGVLSLNIEGLDSSEAGSLLENQYGIQTRIGLHCAPEAHKTIGTYPGGTVRFSWGWKSSEKDIKKAAEAVIEISKAVRSQG